MSLLLPKGLVLGGRVGALNVAFRQSSFSFPLFYLWPPLNEISLGAKGSMTKT